MSVQIGFVVGAMLSAVLNLADRISAPRLIALSALVQLRPGLPRAAHLPHVQSGADRGASVRE